MDGFKDKVAVITGAASGMGRATALAFAREGAHVAIADLNDQRARETADEITARGVQAIAVHCDVGDDADVAALRQAVVDRFGRTDILMNNAGVLPVGPFEDTPIAAWERVLQINFLSVVRCTQAFLPDLLAAGEAHIINTASLAGLMGYDPYSLAYAAAKAAVVNLSEGLAVALRPRGVGVTCLCPGPVVTNIREQISLHGNAPQLGVYPSSKYAARTADEVAAMVLEAVRAKRFLLATNEEVYADLTARAADPDRFIDEVVRVLAQAAPAGKGGAAPGR
jgi:NAD(P)-dependent dehydrogenase (short-subunit alcohol dehydrogenase family)